MAKIAKKYTVVVDTREKAAYTFKEFDNCSGMIRKKLDTGDYSIEGLENVVCIERKATVTEIANNITDTTHRFDREIQRMSFYEHKFIVCEFSIDDLIKFPEGSDLPISVRDKLKVGGKFLLKKLMEYQVYSNVHIIFCNNKENAFYFVASLMKRLSEKYS